MDEPTNNLDQQGIEHLTGFLMMYEKTVIVISHDADFLNAFSDGVLYLDVFTHKIEQYTGNYYDVVEEIKNRIEREPRSRGEGPHAIVVRAPLSRSVSFGLHAQLGRRRQPGAQRGGCCGLRDDGNLFCQFYKDR